MKKYVFTVKDDVCAANGKDTAATELITKMKLWGDVEDYDRVITAAKAEYQITVDNLTAQINAIKAHDLSADELELIKAYRACKATITGEYQTRIDTLETQLDDIHREEQSRIDKIKAILGVVTA